MITFEQYNHKIFFKNASETEKEFLDKKLKFFSPKFGFGFEKKFTVTSILNKKEKSFPAAYLSRILSKLEKEKIKYKVEDCRQMPLGRFNFMLRNTLPELWVTQKEALEAIKTHNVGVISSATGSGKSRLILETVLDKNCKTLIVVPTENIRDQLVDFFEDYIGDKNVTTKAPKLDADFYLKSDEDEEVTVSDEDEEEIEETPVDKLKKIFNSGTSHSRSERSSDSDKKLSQLNNLYTHSNYDEENVSPEAKFKKDKGLYKYKDKKDVYQKEKKKKIKSIRKKIKPVTIMCYQSLRNVSREFLKEIECIIVDECHQSSAETIRTSLLEMETAGYRYFFSATPWRDMTAQMELLISSIGENMIYELKGKDAADQNIISRPKYRLVNPPKPLEWLRDIPKRKYRELLERGIIGNESRNQVIVEEAIELYENEFNVFIAVDEISHLMILEKRFKDKGIDVITIHGEMDSHEKNNKVKQVGEKKGSCISIGTMAVGIGTNMPEINAVVLASGGKSTIRFLQRIGRGSRKTASDKDFIVVDFFDWYHDTLIKHSKERVKTFEKEFEMDGMSLPKE
jgi:superfamily II DNA or RNA helicase